MPRRPPSASADTVSWSSAPVTLKSSSSLCGLKPLSASGVSKWSPTSAARWLYSAYRARLSSKIVHVDIELVGQARAGVRTARARPVPDQPCPDRRTWRRRRGRIRVVRVGISRRWRGRLQSAMISGAQQPQHPPYLDDLRRRGATPRDAAAARRLPRPRPGSATRSLPAASPRNAEVVVLAGREATVTSSGAAVSGVRARMSPRWRQGMISRSLVNFTRAASTPCR